jgi:succinoglycan biosynthesis protein ExoA
MIAAIIPTLNEADHIGALLHRLLSDGADDLVEILVADGGSTDGTREIVAEAARADPRVRLQDNPDRIQAAGVNRAALAADPRATVLVRVDAHAGYPAGYLRRLQDVLNTTQADSVVVRLHTRGEGCFQKAVAAASNSGLGTGGAAHRVGGVSRWIDHGHHAAFRRESFTAIGGYDPQFRSNEDAELDVRLRRNGGRIWFASDIQVDYYPRSSPSALMHQYFRYGEGRAANLLKNGERLRPRQAAPPALVVVLLLALAGAPVAPWTLALPAAYFGASVLAASAMAIRAKEPCLLGVGAALPIMHLAWGAGFLLALCRRRRTGPALVS